MVQFFEKGDFSDDGTGDTFVEVEDGDFFDGDNAAGVAIAAAENSAKAAFAEGLKDLHVESL